MNQPLLNQPAPQGHNHPPSDIEILQGRLQEDHAELLDKAEKRLANADRIPAVCKDDATAAKITDMIKLLNNVRTEFEKTHKVEKEPFLSSGRVVDAFFKQVIDKINQAARKANKPLTDFQLRKAEDVRRQAAELAEKSRVEAEKHANAGAALEHSGMHAAAGVAFSEAEAYDRRADAADVTVQAKPSQLVQTRSQGGAVASLRMRWVGEIIDRNQLDLELLRPYIHIDALTTALNAYVRSGGKVLKGAKIYETAKAGVK